MPSDDPDLRSEIRDLRAELAAIDDRLDAVERRLDEPDGGDDAADFDDAADADADGEPESEPIDELIEPDEPAGAAEPFESAESAGPADDAGSEPTADSESAAADSAHADSTDAGSGTTEFDLGIKWLGVVGALTLVVGVAFAVRYAIEIGLVGYLGRVLLGVSGGLALIGGGVYARQQAGYRLWGGIVAGAGVAITYLSVYAAHGFEAYRDAIGLPEAAVVGLLVVVAAGGVALALRAESRLLAAEAFLLGYLGALLGPGFDALGLAYAAVLALGVLAVVAARPWPELALGSAVGAAAVYVRWADDSMIPIVAGSFLLLAFFVHLAATYPLSRDARDSGRLLVGTTAALTVLTALLFAPLADLLVLDQYADARTWLHLALAATFLSVHVGFDRLAVRRNLAAPYLTALFLVVSAAAAFDSFGTTVAISAIVVAFVASSLRAAEPPFRYAGHGVAALLVGKLLAVDWWQLAAFDAAEPLAPSRLPAFLAAVVAFGAVAVLLDRNEGQLSRVEAYNRLPASVGYAWTAVVLLALVAVLELGSGFWETAIGVALVAAFAGLSRFTDVPAPRLSAHLLAAAIAGKVLLFDSTGLTGFDAADPLASTRPAAFLVTIGGFAAMTYALSRRPERLTRVERLDPVPLAAIYAWATLLLVVVGLGLELSGVWISVAWALLGVALLGVGLGRDLRLLRHQGIVVLGATVLKAFLFDTRGLDPLSRALSFLTLGALLLVASYAYARYARRLVTDGTDSSDVVG